MRRNAVASPMRKISDSPCHLFNPRHLSVRSYPHPYHYENSINAMTATNLIEHAQRSWCFSMLLHSQICSRTTLHDLVRCPCAACNVYVKSSFHVFALAILTPYVLLVLLNIWMTRGDINFCSLSMSGLGHLRESWESVGQILPTCQPSCQAAGLPEATQCVVQ